MKNWLHQFDHVGDHPRDQIGVVNFALACMAGGP